MALTDAFIGLGSNLEHPVAQLAGAIAELAARRCDGHQILLPSGSLTGFFFSLCPIHLPRHGKQTREKRGHLFEPHGVNPLPRFGHRG